MRHPNLRETVSQLQRRSLRLGRQLWSSGRSLDNNLQISDALGLPECLESVVREQLHRGVRVMETRDNLPEPFRRYFENLPVQVSRNI